LLQEGGNVVSYTHRPPLLPHEIPLVLISDGGRFDHRAITRPEGFFFFFFLSSGSTSAIKAYCATLNFHQHIQYPCVSYKETEVPECGCVYIFWFKKRFPKHVVALWSRCLAAASDMLHCFSLHPAESAGWMAGRNNSMTNLNDTIRNHQNAVIKIN
jgi:hypothetical protein